ncbi:hypothetical protein [Marinobacterium aestuarii]|uniref:hypothetical protein n=1 Tax=Marinobacterium aestuarii TaxID=1821621 RepID=UPI001D0F4F91|nr:hypothetical protein [Marinobacterium aestuarii]
MIESQEIPPYQKIWMSADDRNSWEHEFGWALLQAARPFDIAHNGVEYFDSDIRFLPDLLRHAWIISTPSGRAEWQAERSLRLATLSGVSIDTANVSVELPDRVSPRPSLSDDSLLPQWFRKRYPAELRSWLVDVESAVRLLGLEHLTKYSPTESRWHWTFALRYQANELLARMDIEATCPSQQALKNRYDVRSLNRWVEHIPTQPRHFRGDWITPDDSRLTVHGADQIDLALAVKNGELSGYRQVHKGLKVIGVHRAEFKQWLNQHLHLVCESSVEQADLSRMTGMPYHISKATDSFASIYTEIRPRAGIHEDLLLRPKCPGIYPYSQGANDRGPQSRTTAANCRLKFRANE